MKYKKKQEYRPDNEKEWKKIMKKYGGLVNNTINRVYTGPPISEDFREDLISNAWVKILKYYDQYNPKLAKFTTFIITYTEYATKDYLRNHDPIAPHNQHSNISIEKIYHDDDGEEDEFNNIHKDDILNLMSTIDDILDDFEKISFLETCMKTLTDLEKDILILKIKHYAINKDLAFQFNISESAARSAFNRGKRKLLKEVKKQIGNIF